MTAIEDKILGALDPEQRVAAEQLLGPVCILAGAGTGKTRAITHRIAYGVASGSYDPTRVLALTFTNRAAAELRARLAELGVSGVSARTFHSAALAQLEYFWPQLAGVPAPRLLESKSKLLAELLKERGMAPEDQLLRSLASEIEFRKYSLLSLSDYQRAIESSPDRLAAMSLAAPTVIEIFGEYESRKKQANQLDFEDVLTLCLGMLRAEPQVAEQVHQQYRFFTIDEYQDVSPLQQALVDAWLGDRNELCVVGDPNQSIFSFAGASNRYLLEFSERFPDASIVELTRNYRSNEAIVGLANRLIAPITGMSPLAAARQETEGSTPGISAFGDGLAEAEAVATEISEAIAAGQAASGLAVLFRFHWQSALVEAALAKRDIPSITRGGLRFFQIPTVLAALRALRAMASGNPEAGAAAAATEVIAELGWRADDRTLVGEALETSRNLNYLLDTARTLAPEATVRDLVSELDEQQRAQHEPQTAGVTLSTMHAAKGLEWDEVWIIGLDAETVPSPYAESEAELREEKRLLYVAVTRARNGLRLSWSKKPGSARGADSRSAGARSRSRSPLLTGIF